MAMYRTVSCTYTDEHLSMGIMSIIAIGVYPIGFMVLITYCSFMYKGQIVQPARIEWLKRMHSSSTLHYGSPLLRM